MIFPPHLKPKPADSPAKPDQAKLHSHQLDRMNRLVLLGRLLPVNRDRLLLLSQKQQIIHASRSDVDSPANLLDEVLCILEDNCAITIGETTGLQMLSRIIPDEDQSRLKPDLQNKMIKMANGG